MAKKSMMMILQKYKLFSLSSLMLIAHSKNRRNAVVVMCGGMAVYSSKWHNV